MIQDKIQNLIKQALKNLKMEEVSFVVEHPEDLKNGDYSTNVAMICAKKLKTNPTKLAEEIIAEISRLNLDEKIEDIQIAGAGFINFYLSPEFFSESLQEILKNKNFGQNQKLKSQKIMVEHTDPNPFKEFHIGHLMPNITGSAIARIFEWNGGKVKQACYQGDVGMHVAKAVWAMQNGAHLNEAYALGAKAYEENESSKKAIEEINKKIYDRSDKKINEVYDAGRKASLQYFDSIYKRLGTNFDYFFFESEVANIGKEIVEKNTGKIFEKGEGGAIIFKAENFDKSLHTRVFITKEGLPTYEAKELGLAKIKYDKYKYDQSIIITGNEVNDYFRVLLCALKQIFLELEKKTTHLSHGMLRLPTGKMSSRTGEVITAEQLIDTVKEKVKGDEKVALGAIKFMILRQSVGGDIIFDIEKSVSTEGDSGVYLQYAYVRAKSVLEKAKKENIGGKRSDLKNSPRSDLEEPTEIERLLYRFPEVILRSGEAYEMHHITNYLTELARSYNSFYGNTKILDKNDPASPYKVALTQAFSIIMKNGLDILGIPTPEKM